ncbi:DUF6934 family protein [Dyadobacter sp. CY326]|uniref:DUF6934 family protein n=1 Tax=Dyadobacter sp. CY326 TaxID=2907300 RepID=UPI001F4130CB|nr:hypothetical protein [Dyadobacter sp. CY326]MCE7067997.1 hypothetical protein [Dyadobacter sp. CY326]
MKHSFYPFRASEDYLSFTFESISKQRIVRKKAEFVKIYADVYNFAFGDLNDEGEIDDLVVTNNKDMEIVFATLIRILLDYLTKYEDNWVYFKGSTPSRTRMYQIILTKEKVHWEDMLIIYGIIDGETYPFELNCRFDAFIITKQ